MASVLHGLRPHDRASRSRVPSSANAVQAIAAQYGINPKTILKWRNRAITADAPMGPKKQASTVLSPARNALQRPATPCNATASPGCPRSQQTMCERRLKPMKIRIWHIGSGEPRRASIKLIIFLAIDRISKFAYDEFHEHAGKMERAAFLEAVIKAFLYRIHKVLTNNGMAFADLAKDLEGPTTHRGAHMFDCACLANQIEHRHTTPGPDS